MVGTKQTKRNGYTIEVVENFFDEESEVFHPGYITFPSFEDFLSVGDIEELMYKVIDRRCEKKGDKEISKYLKEIEMIIADCEYMDIKTNYEKPFGMTFPSIDEFLFDFKIGKYKRNKNLKKKFDKTGKLLWEKGIHPFEW